MILDQFWTPDHSDAERALMIEGWMDVLQGCSDAEIRAAWAEYQRSGPRSDKGALLRPDAGAIYRIIDRARAVEFQRRKQERLKALPVPPPPPVPTDAQMEERRRRADEIIAAARIGTGLNLATRSLRRATAEEVAEVGLAVRQAFPDISDDDLKAAFQAEMAARGLVYQAVGRDQLGGGRNEP